MPKNGVRITYEEFMLPYCLNPEEGLMFFSEIAEKNSGFIL